MADDPGRELLEQRKQLASHANPQETRVFVGRVGRERDRMSLDVSANVRAARLDERTEQLQPRVDAEGSAGREDGEAARPRAAHETQEDGLGSIVGVVRGGGARHAGDRHE